MKLALLSMVILMAACVPEEAPKAIGMANPASVYCAKQGGKSVSRETAAGTATDCHLPDGRVIDEWDFYRANHP